MSKEQAINIIEHLTNVLDCKGMGFDEDNTIELNIEDEMTAILFYSDDLDALVTTIFIAPILNEDSDILYDILCGNFMWSFTAGGHLGIDRETGLLTLQRLIVLQANDAINTPQEEALGFEDAFLNLVEAARYWKDVALKQASNVMLAKA